MLVVALLLAAPAIAHADDAAVRAAWNSEDARLAKLTGQTSKALRAWSRSGLKRTGGVLRLLATTERVALAVERRVAQAQPSSEDGARARAAAVASLTQYRASLRMTVRTVLAAAGGWMKAARTLSRRARALERTARAGGRSAERWFAAAAEARRPKPAEAPPKSEPQPASKPAPATQETPQQPSPPAQQPPPPPPKDPPPPDPLELLEIPPLP